MNGEFSAVRREIELGTATHAYSVGEVLREALVRLCRKRAEVRGEVTQFYACVSEVLPPQAVNLRVTVELADMDGRHACLYQEL